MCSSDLLWRLPVVFAIEANRIAQTTPTELQLAGDLARRCAAFDIAVEEMPAADFEPALAAAVRAVDAVRAEQRPRCLISHAIRLGPHSKGDDTRAPALLHAAWAGDPLAALRRQTGTSAEAIDREIAALIQETLAATLADRPGA